MQNRIRDLLDAKSLVRLRATNRYFHKQISVYDVERRLCHEAVEIGPCVYPRVCVCYVLCMLGEQIVCRANWHANQPYRAYRS